MLELICENCGKKFIRRKFVRVPLCLKCLDHRRHPRKGTTREKVDRNNEIMLAKKSGKKQNQIARELGISKQAVSEIIKRLTKRGADSLWAVVICPQKNLIA